MLTCEICGKECKTAQGLSGHRRLKHLVVSGGSSGGDQSDQGSVSGGERSDQGSVSGGDQSGDHSGDYLKAAAAVAVVGAGVVAGDQSSEGSEGEPGGPWAERKILSIIREHQETGEWDPEFLEVVKKVALEWEREVHERGMDALRTFGRFESS